MAGSKDHTKISTTNIIKPTMERSRLMTKNPLKTS
jgi:hypothetical protein